MGIELHNLPDYFLSKLPEEERKKLGRAGMTGEEAQDRYVAKNERELQRNVSNYLNREAIPFVNTRMDKKSTLAVGSPDYVACVVGKFVAIECKCKATGGKLTPEQEDAMRYILSAGGRYLVIYSIEQLIKALGELRVQ